MNPFIVLLKMSSVGLIFLGLSLVAFFMLAKINHVWLRSLLQLLTLLPLLVGGLTVGLGAKTYLGQTWLLEGQSFLVDRFERTPGLSRVWAVTLVRNDGEKNEFLAVDGSSLPWDQFLLSQEVGAKFNRERLIEVVKK